MVHSAQKIKVRLRRWQRQFFCTLKYQLLFDHRQSPHQKNESNLYRYGGSIYCEQDLERAKLEGWHK